MNRIASLLLILCLSTFCAVAQTPEQKEMEQKMKDMEERMKEMEARLKELDRGVLVAPRPPSPPGVPQPPTRRKIVIINGERVDSLGKELKILEEIEFGDADSLDLGDRMKIYENDDSVVVKIGGLRVKVDEEQDLNINSRLDPDKKPKRKTVEPTFAGVRVGLNNLMFGNRIGVTPQNYKDLELITGKSIHVNVGLVGIKVRPVSDMFTIHTGLALDFNNYRFRSDSVLRPKTDVVDFYSRSEQGNVTKNKLAATYLELPVKLQFASGGSTQSFKLGLGFRAAYLLGAHTKVVVDDEKEKVRDDFNLTAFRYGVFAQVGVSWFNFYVNYDISPLFREGVQPRMHPVAAGIVFTGW